MRLFAWGKTYNGEGTAVCQLSQQLAGRLDLGVAALPAGTVQSFVEAGFEPLSSR